MGTPLVLREWQKDLIRRTLDPTDPDTGKPRVRLALWSMARKNAKTALAAALVLAFLIGPEAEPNGEVLSAASDKEQAAIIYKMAKQMIELDEELSQLCKCIDTVKTIACYHLGSKYKSLTADAHRQHGGNPLFCIYDELAQASDRELFDVLSTAFGAQEKGLLLVISTQSNDSTSVMSELVDDAIAQMRGELDDPYFFGMVYAVPEDPDDDTFGPVPGVIEVDGKRVVDIYDERNWYLANPALGDFKVLSDMRSRAMRAKRSAANEAAFRNLHLNQRADGAASFVKRADWLACQKTVPDEELRKLKLHLGLDLSSRLDLSSLTMAFEGPDFVAVRSRHYTPEDTLEDRAKQDKAPYVEWVDAGHLTACPGKSVSYYMVAKDVIELARAFPNVAQLAFDRWRIDEFKKELERAGAVIKSATEKDPKTGKEVSKEFVFVGDVRFQLVPHGQGFKDMAPSIDNLEELIITHKLKHDGNPVLTYCISNVKLTRDDAGNRKFDKKRETRRIDGAVSLAMASASISKFQEVASAGPSVYETRGIIAF